MSKISTMMRIMTCDHKIFLIAGYLIAGIWLTTSVACAFYSLTLPVSQPQIISPQPEVASSLNFTMTMPPVIAEDITVLRDPFLKGAPQAPIVKKTDVQDPSGLRVKAIILSSKNGVVIEDAQRGTVYFLSEGDKVNGVLVKSITKVGVTVEVAGKQIDLSLSGGKE